MQTWLTRITVVSVGLISASTASSAVVLGPISGASSDYYLLSKQSWNSAETEATSLGGHLVTVNDAAENAFLVNKFVLNGHTADPLWIGLNDASVEGTFVWSGGQPLIYTNWNSGEPNNAGGNEDYVAINFQGAAGIGDHSTWNDVPVNGTVAENPPNVNGPYYAIAEVAVPEPSAITLASITAIAAIAIRKRLRRHKSVFAGGQSMSV